MWPHKNVERTFGVRDFWINNVMVSVFSPVKEMAPEEFRRVTQVTYPGVVWNPCRRVLAQAASDSQQTDEPDDPNRRNNLWNPVSGDPDAHGRFDSRARPRSLQFWATRYRRQLAELAGAVAVGVIARARVRSSS
jgi:hypothetical protein